MYKRRQRSTCYPGTAYRKQDSFLTEYFQNTVVFRCFYSSAQFQCILGRACYCRRFYPSQYRDLAWWYDTGCVPTVVIYFGCYIFWIIGYLYNAAMDKRHCYRFLMADWLAKAVCFICYVVYPTTNTRPEIVGSDIWAQLMRFLYSMDAADNLFPSIHCLVSWLCYIGIRGNKKYRSGYVQLSVFAL